MFRLDLDPLSLEPTSKATNDIAWVTPLFIAVSILCILPIWCVNHYPSTDGPAHLYNAWIIDEVLAHHHSAVTKIYAIDLRPWPNWLGHAILAALLLLVAPAIAEKILVTGIALLFLGGAWLLASAHDERNRTYAFLALPFLFSWLFQVGFYNFMISAGLYFAAVALFWRNRERPHASTITALAIVLVLCYFSHPQPTALAEASIGVLWLCSLPGKRFAKHVLHLIALVPAAALLIWYAQQNRDSTAVPGDPIAAVKSLFRADILITFDNRQRALGIAIVIVLVLLASVTALRDVLMPSLRSRRLRLRPVDGFLVLAVILAAVSILAPDAYAGGLFLRERAALLFYVLPIAWISPTLPRKLRAALALALTVIGIGCALFLLHWYRRSDRAVTEYLAATSAIPSNSAVIPLLFGRAPAGNRLTCLSHAIDYTAISKGLVDYDNYEPVTGYFPTTVRPGAFVPGVYGLEANPDLVDVEQVSSHVDVFFTWAMPPDSTVASKLAHEYQLAFESDKARVFARSQPRPDDAEFVLLPLSGTVQRTRGAAAHQFEVKQTMTNVGGRPVSVTLSGCAITPCDLTVKPGATITLAAYSPYTFVYVGRGESQHLSFRTVVHRVDRPDLWPALQIPAVQERDFRLRRVVLSHVTWSRGTTVTLRAWRIGDDAKALLVSVVLPTGRVFARQLFHLSSDMLILDMSTAFPNLPNSSADLVIDTLGESRVWAFATVNDYAAGNTRLYLPPG